MRPLMYLIIMSYGWVVRLLIFFFVPRFTHTLTLRKCLLDDELQRAVLPEKGAKRPRVNNYANLSDKQHEILIK